MTAITKMTKRKKYEYSFCLMKRDGVDKMFPFVKRGISKWDLGYEPKIIN